MPPWLGLATAGVGVLGSIFGGKPKPIQNPYAAPAASMYTQAGGYGNSVANEGQRQQTAYNQFAPQQQNIMQSYLQRLGMNYGTDANSEAQFNRSNGNAALGWGGAQANLESELAQRGIAGAGPNSAYAGGTAAILGQEAGSNANIQNQVAQQSIAQNMAQAGEANNVASGYANNLYNEGQSGLEGGASAVDSAAGGLFGIGQAQAQAQAAANASQQNSFGSLVGLGGQIYGMGTGGTPSGSPRAINPYTPNNPATWANGGMGVLAMPPAYNTSGAYGG